MPTAVEIVPRLKVDLAGWLSRYLVGEVTLDDFQRWFVPATWEVDRLEPELAATVHELELLVAEARHRTDEDLKQRLNARLQELAPPELATYMGTASNTLFRDSEVGSHS